MQFFTANGDPLVGGKLYTYAAGTTSPLATYTDLFGTTSNPNPVVMDSRGEASVWLGEGTYKFVLKDALDTLIWTVDNISGNGQSVSFAFQNPIVMVASQSVLSGYNALSAGPLTINSGVTVTVPTGSTWTIV
jgi:hypothetical protein